MELLIVLDLCCIALLQFHLEPEPCSQSTKVIVKVSCACALFLMANYAQAWNANMIFQFI